MCSTMVGGGWRLAVGGGWRLAVGNWRLVAVGGGWRRSVVGDWWLVAVGSGWQLVVGRCWRLAAVGGWWLVAVGGWRLVASGWWRLVVGGWWRLVVDGSWRLAVGGPLGRSLRAVLSKKKKKSGPLRTALLPPHNHQKQRPEKDAGEQHPSLCFTRDTGTRDTQTVCLWSEHELIKLCMCVQLRPKQTGWTTALHLQQLRGLQHENITQPPRFLDSDAGDRWQ